MKLKQVNYTQVIKDFLDKEPIINLNIIGALSYEPEAPIYVDDETSPTGVYIPINGLNYLYTQEMNFVDQVIQQFTPNGEYCFSGVKREIADYMKSKYECIWENPCDIYYYPHGKIDLSDVKSEVVTIPLEEAEGIDSYYTYKNEWSLEEIRANLRRRPSAGIYEDGQLVCWVMAHEDDSMGVMYTMEGYRRKGYAIDVSLVLMDKLLKLGKVPYLLIVESNKMSPGLALQCGFVKSEKCSWIGFRIDSK